ncbi:MAG TPA: hypothetical protein VK706_00005, partial [Candidatus Sulfotelmatobacter sp.]|nr:hypothetical protein [Candidatus Sulfotelmatobacter sp.]
ANHNLRINPLFAAQRVDRVVKLTSHRTYSVMKTVAAYQVSTFQGFKTVPPLIFNFETLKL